MQLINVLIFIFGFVYTKVFGEAIISVYVDAFDGIHPAYLEKGKSLTLTSIIFLA